MAHDVIDKPVKPQHPPRPPPKVLGINIEKPKFPQYAVYARRIESFKTWPDYMPVDKYELIEAGLVYTGVGDSVRCFFCGGGLRNWEAGDKPMEEHAKWYPTCPHILLVKGQHYIDRVLGGEQYETDGSKTEKQIISSETIKADHLASAASQSCIEMGFSEDMVKKAIDIFIRKNGNVEFKGKDLCEIIYEIEENLDTANFDEPLMEKEEVIEDEEVLEPLECLQEENRRLKTNQQCKICLEGIADVVFLPCGHMVSCPQCAPALTKCPVCRKIVNGHIKTFFATVK